MHGPQNVRSMYHPTYALRDTPFMSYVHSHMFRHLGPSIALEPVNVQWICHMKGKRKHTETWMYRTQEVYTMISVKLILLPVCMVMTVIFLTRRWGQLMRIGVDCLVCGLGFRLDGPGFESTTDTFSQRLFECGVGEQIRTWTKERLAWILRTIPERIPSDWLLLPHFTLWRPRRRRELLWVLANLVIFRTQQQRVLTLQDCIDFMKRSKWKLYQSHKRVASVGNYLSVIDMGM